MTQDLPRWQNEPQINGVVKLPSGSPERATLPETCDYLRRMVDTLLAEDTDNDAVRKVQSRVQESIVVIEEALQRYGPEHLSLAHNGGKDCLVLLVLILACLPSWASSPEESSSQNSNLNSTPSQTNGVSPTAPPRPPISRTIPSTLQAVYVAPPDPFPEVEAFVTASARTYHLDVSRYSLPMRDALQAYLAERPAVRAVFVGTRRADPHGERLSHFEPTDKGWPALMRVHPIIDWHYGEIWTFLRHLSIPVCELYDLGYTSLGSMSDTHPNPALALAEPNPARPGDGQAKFRPAYELTDEGQERLGRDR